MTIRRIAVGLLFFAAIVGISLYVFSARKAYAGTADSDRVLRGIPAIARAFAPVSGVNWEDLANVLAGICAVESRCDFTYPHYVRGSGGNQIYSQYQGLFQMNVAEVARAETTLEQMLPQMQAAAANDPEQRRAFDFVRQAIDSSRGLSREARRFHPEYGIIIGAAKHIRTNAVLATQYPRNPLLQAAGHLTAQFSGITESKILAGNFTAPITGTPGDVRTEAGALAVNRVSGTTVANAIDSAGSTYQGVMRPMMARMSQVTNGLTTVPTNVLPFVAPAFANQQGTTPILGVSYGGASTLMETGMMRAVVAAAFPQTNPPSTTNIPPYNGTPYVPTPVSPSTATSTTSGSTGPGIGLLIAQPSVVTAGRAVSVSWTSLRMSDSQPCQIFVNDSEFLAQGNEGTRAKQFSAGLGTQTFTMKCTDKQGKAFSQSATVTVQ